MPHDASGHTDLAIIRAVAFLACVFFEPSQQAPPATPSSPVDDLIVSDSLPLSLEDCGDDPADSDNSDNMPCNDHINDVGNADQAPQADRRVGQKSPRGVQIPRCSRPRFDLSD